MNDHDLDSRLRAAAHPVPRGRVHGAGAQMLLDRIVATDPTETPTPIPERRRGRGWWVTAGAFAAAVTAFALVAPGVGPQRAYGSWSATPGPMTVGEAATVARECIGKLSYMAAGAYATRKLIAERRGAYGYVSIVTDRWSAACFRDRDGRVENSGVIAEQVGDAQLGRRGVELQTWGQLRTGEGYVRLMSGHVGTAVTAVDVSPRAGETVHATLDDGYFLVWYPEKAGAGAGTTVTLRLADGGTVDGLSASSLYEQPALDQPG